MNEGAGFGINASQSSIYYNAVQVYYKEYPEKYREDLAVCNENAKHHEIDLTAIEEVYNFAKFFKFNYIKLRDSKTRFQLNTKLRQESFEYLLNSKVRA